MGRTLNYQEWKDLHREALESFPGKTVMVFFSGGKDSSAALHLIQKAGEEFGFSFEAHAGMYPNHVFIQKEWEEIDRFWRSRGAAIQWHRVSEGDDLLAHALGESVSPCLICNTTKKKALIDFLKKRGMEMSSLVIVMSYSLWDLASASIEHILGSVYASEDSSPSIRHKPMEERYIETFQRFYPLLSMQSGLVVFKPLIRYNDQEIMDFISKEGIQVLTTHCIYRQYRPKRHFSSYYEKMNLQFDFDKVLRFARSALQLPEERFFSDMGEERYLKKVI
jgi:tRNA(Ile)-lysidine synthase TilS/MesJ